jgi:hypothetical protein
MNKNVFPNAKLKTYPQSTAYQQSFPHFPHSELNLMFKHTIQQPVEIERAFSFYASKAHFPLFSPIFRGKYQLTRSSFFI